MCAFGSSLYQDAWGQIDPLPGYEMHEAPEGGELTEQQKHDNWLYGGQGIKDKEGNLVVKDRYSANPFGFGQKGMFGYIFAHAAGAKRAQLRAKRLSSYPRLQRSAPIAQDDSDPGESYSIKSDSTMHDNVRKQKYKKQAGAVSSVKQGTKKLKAISDKSLPTSSGDKSGLNI